MCDEHDCCDGTTAYCRYGGQATGISCPICEGSGYGGERDAPNQPEPCIACNGYGTIPGVILEAATVLERLARAGVRR